MSTHGGTSTSAPPATTVTGPDAIGAPAVVGTGLHYARNDHDHGLPALDYNSMQYNDLLGWTNEPENCNGAYAPNAAATLQLHRIPLPKSLTVTNICIQIGTQGTVLTHCFVALFKSDGTIVGQSADQSASWSSTQYTYLTLALAGGPYVCAPLAANDFLWPALYIGTASVLPTFYGPAGGGPANVGTVAARTRQGTIAQADTATLVSIVPASISQGIVTCWFGLR
jgi:hypothetical protein